MSSVVHPRAIEIARIDASNRLRPINPNVVSALAEEHDNGNRWPAIRVVERGEGFRLISGGHRLAAAARLGWTEIEAEVCAASDYPDEDAIRLDEVRENLLRYELTALDRAVHLSTWKRLYEAQNTTAPKGRKKAAEKLAQSSAPIFAAAFSTAAAAALDISERSVQAAVSIATGIAPEVRERIALAPLADNQSELLQLSRQEAGRQGQIVGLLLANPPSCGSVAEAVALLDKTPAPVKLMGWQKVSDTFSRLKAREQHAFFDAHVDAIEEWIEQRRSTAARAA